MEPLQTTGEFWSPDNAEMRVTGILNWEPKSGTRITLKSHLIQEFSRTLERNENGLSLVHSGDPARIVADMVPYTLLGTTDAGPVTCIDSYVGHPASYKLSAATFSEQTWVPQILVVGAHLPTGKVVALDAVRFTLDDSSWMHHLPDLDVANGTAGELKCAYTNEDRWFQFRPSFSMNLQSALHVVRSILTLLQLATDRTASPLRIQVREEGLSDWLEVKQKADTRGDSRLGTPALLDPSAITLKHLALWLGIDQTMDGLASAVTYPVRGEAVEVHALVACTLVEGIHKRIVNANNQSYSQRASELLELAKRILPEIVDPIRNWHKVVKYARNDLAHHNTERPYDEKTYNWLISELSVYWVLRVCLLSQTGFTDSEIAQAFRSNQGYQFFRQNLVKVHNERKVELAAKSTSNN